MLFIVQQKLKADMMENFEHQLQELVEEFVQDVEKIEQSPSCNGTNPFVPYASFKYYYEGFSLNIRRPLCL